MSSKPDLGAFIKTYDVRGLVGSQLTDDVVAAIGAAFVDEIDPKLARGQVTGSTVPPQVRALATGADPERKFRKI